METKLYMIQQLNRITPTQIEDHVLGVFTTREAALKRMREIQENRDWIYDIYRQMWDEDNEEEPEVDIDEDSICVDYPDSHTANSMVYIRICEVEANKASNPWLNADYIK